MSGWAGGRTPAHSARLSTSAIRASPLTVAAASVSVPRTGTEATRSVTVVWVTSSSPRAGSTFLM